MWHVHLMAFIIMRNNGITFINLAIFTLLCEAMLDCSHNSQETKSCFHFVDKTPGSQRKSSSSAIEQIKFHL